MVSAISNIVMAVKAAIHDKPSKRVSKMRHWRAGIYQRNLRRPDVDPGLRRKDGARIFSQKLSPRSRAALYLRVARKNKNIYNNSNDLGHLSY
jgi:hypothetical protein